MLKIILTLGLALTAADLAWAGREGNGGGSWVCREKNGNIRWIKFVDLFEAKSEFGLTIAQRAGTYQEIVDQMLYRLLQADKELYTAVEAHFEDVNYLLENPPKVHHTSETLELINDSLFRLRPNVEECQGGQLVIDPKSGKEVIPYEQVANYKNDDNILVQSELFNSFTEVEKAGLNFHEPIYKYRRDIAKDTDSSNSRRIVGLIFSTLTTEELGFELRKIRSESKRVSNEQLYIDWGLMFFTSSPQLLDQSWVNDFSIYMQQLTFGMEGIRFASTANYEFFKPLEFNNRLRVPQYGFQGNVQFLSPSCRSSVQTGISCTGEYVREVLRTEAVLDHSPGRSTYYLTPETTYTHMFQILTGMANRGVIHSFDLELIKDPDSSTPYTSRVGAMKAHVRYYHWKKR